jgi:hypothetical protein
MSLVDLNLYFSLVFFARPYIKDHLGNKFSSLNSQVFLKMLELTFPLKEKMETCMFLYQTQFFIQEIYNVIKYYQVINQLVLFLSLPSLLSLTILISLKKSKLTFRIGFSLNDPQLELHKILDNRLQVLVLYNNAGYTFYELFFRYGFLLVSCIVFLVFLVFTRYRQPFSDWQTEQKWMLFVLFLLVCFNNPLYVFEYLSKNWIFIFLNINLRATFICVLLLSILIFTHSMYVTPIERTFFKFYALKSFIVGSFWILLVMCFTYLK